MVETEKVICSAYPDHRVGNSDLNIILTPTGECIHSVTSTITLALDGSGNRYFLKPILNQDKEPDQLVYLHSVGIPVPDRIFFNRNSSIMATPYVGDTLSDVSGSLERGEVEQLFFQAGVLLRQVHQALQLSPPTNNIITVTYNSTAHIVDNFYYKHIGTVDRPEYLSHKELVVRAGLGNPTPTDESAIAEILLDKPFIPIPEHGQAEFKRLIASVNELAGDFLNRLRPHIRILTTQEGSPKPFLDLADRQLFEGDYKSDNLLVTRKSADWVIMIIDPVISRGITQFDLAKFTGRFLLERYSAHNQDALSRFFEGYGYKPVAGALEYGPFSFSDLVHMDILNILRSYAKRWLRADRGYRLVRSLDSAAFCLENRRLIESSVIID